MTAICGIRAGDLQPGDEYDYCETRVSILGLPQLTDDLFGRPEYQIWARRHDTSETGWLRYGFEAIVASPVSSVNR